MTESRKPRKVLIVEDEETSQNILSTLCIKLGIEPTIAGTAEEGNKAMACHEYDLILMDVKLPGLSGIDLTKEIRLKENGTGRRTLIVAVTGTEPKEAKAKCLEAGMDGFFTKPLNRMMFWTFLQKVFK